MELFKTLFQLLAIMLQCRIGKATIRGNGRPGCKTEEELKIAIYRDLNDPTAYWKCVNHEPAIRVRCPDQTGFMDSQKKCVGWESWQWEEPKLPPSLADD